MSYIRKRKDNRWQYSKIVDGKRVYIYAKTLKSLKEKIKEQKPAKIEKPTAIGIYDWAKEYSKIFKHNKTLADKTESEYNNLIDNHIKNYFGNKELKKISPLELQDFLNTRPSRIAQKLFQFLRVCLKKAYAFKYTRDNLAEFIEKPIGEKKEKKKPLTLKEQKKFLETLETAPKLVKKFCMFCIILGTRRNEALEFYPEDIDRENHTIFIRGTKTENAERTIRITEAMMDYLLEGTMPHEKVFSWNPKTAYDKVKQQLERAGIFRKTTHNLRYTCATNLYYLGMPDKHRQHQMGHASIVTTNDIYTVIELDVKADDIRQLYKGLYYEFT